MRTRQIDENNVTGLASAPKTFVIDTTAPGTLSASLQNDTGTDRDDNITADSTVIVSGLEPGATWEFSLNNGAWLAGSGAAFELPGAGSYDVTLRQTDLAGNAGQVSAPVSFTIDPAVADPVSVNQVTQALNDGDIIISGTAPAGALVFFDVVSSAGANIARIDTFAGPDGNWSVNLTNYLAGQVGPDLTAGTYQIEANAFNFATGDFFADQTTNELILTVPVGELPPAPGFTLTDTGNSTTDKLTFNPVINVTGVLPGATWSYSLDQGTSWLTGMGNSFQLPADGAYSILLRQTDTAGNTSLVGGDAGRSAMDFDGVDDILIGTNRVAAASDFTYVVTVEFDRLDGDVALFGSGDANTGNQRMIRILGSDTGPSTINIHAANTGDEQAGSFAFQTGVTYSFIATRTHLFVHDGTTTHLIWDNANFAQDRGPDLLLGAWVGGPIRVLDGRIGAALVFDQAFTDPASFPFDYDGTVTDATGLVSHYDFSLSDPLSSQLDNGDVLQGNGGGPTLVSVAPAVILDRTAPVQPTLALADDNGVSAFDGVTEDATVLVGGLEAGGTWEYSLNAGTNWTNGSGDSFELPSPGTYDLRVRQYDAAGNVSDFDALPPAARFDGDGDFLTANSPIVGATQFTYVATVTFDTLFGREFALFGNGDLATTAQRMIRIVGAEGDATQITIHTANVGDEKSVNFNLSPDVAYTFIATYNSLYVHDGSITHLIWDDASFAQDRGNALQFGAWAGGPIRVLAGSLSNVQVYDRTLTGSEIATVAAGGLIADTSLKAYYPFTGATPLADRSGNGNDLTIASGDPQFSGSITVVTLEAGEGPDTIPPAAPGLALRQDTGASDTDGVTQNDTFDVTGLEAGATWEISFDGGTNWVTGGGTHFALVYDGTYNITLRQTDAAGNVSDISASRRIVLDRTAPLDPVLALVNDTGMADDGISSDGRVTITTLEPGDSWEYRLDYGDWLPGSGTFFDLNQEGSFDPQVRVTDLAGNSRELLPYYGFTVDTTAPDAPTVVLRYDSGSSDNDGVTVDGLLIVTGIGDYEAWEYSLDAGANWTAGDIAAEKYIDLNVDGVYEVAVRTIDAAGNIGDANPTLRVVLDRQVVAPFLLINGVSNGDVVTTVPTVPVFDLEEGATWEYTLDGGITWLAGSGSSFDLPDYGSYEIAVRQVDLAGNSASGTVGSVTLEPALPPLDTPTVQAINLSTFEDSEFILTGTASTAPGAVTTVRVYDGSGNFGGVEVTVQGDGTWALAASQTMWPNSTVFNGLYRQFADFVGNPGTYEVVVTTTLDEQVATDTSTAEIIRDANVIVPPVTVDLLTASLGAGDIIITGTARANAGVTLEVIGEGYTYIGYAYVYADANGQWALNATEQVAFGNFAALTPGQFEVRASYFAYNIYTDIKDTTSNELTITASLAAPEFALANDSGADDSDGVTNNGQVNVIGIADGATWEFSLDNGATWNPGSGTAFTLPSDGSYGVTVRQSRDGTTSDPAALRSLTLRTALPDAPFFTLDQDSGVSALDGITNSPFVTVGGLESSASWDYTLDDGVTWTEGSGTGFQVNFNGEGSYGVAVRQTDFVGNQSAASPTQTIVYDVSIATPQIALNFDTGADGADGLTNDGSIRLMNFETGAVWEYTQDGGTTWLTGSALGYLIFEADGDYSVMVRQTDLAGNASENSNLLTFTLDTAAPVLDAGFAVDDGPSGSDGISTLGTVDVTGLDAAVDWSYSIDGGATWFVGAGTSFDLPALGQYAVTVRQTDLAGNTGQSAVRQLTMAVAVNGTEGADDLTGTDDPSFADLGDGADTFLGGSADDTILGGAGADSLSGGDGSDSFWVQDGDLAAGEVIDGGAGHDAVLLDGGSHDMFNVTLNDIEEIRLINAAGTEVILRDFDQALLIAAAMGDTDMVMLGNSNAGGRDAAALFLDVLAAGIEEIRWTTAQGTSRATQVSDDTVQIVRGDGLTTEISFDNGLRSTSRATDVGDTQTYETYDIDYDAMGRLLKTDILSDEGLRIQREYTDGVISRQVREDTSVAGSAVNYVSIETIYDSAGNATRTTQLSDSGLETVTTFANGKFATQTITDLSLTGRAASFSVSQASYDTSGVLIQKTVLGDNLLETETTYVNGRASRVVVNDLSVTGRAAGYSQSETEYDASGSRTSERVLLDSGLEKVTTFVAGKATRVVQTDLTPDGTAATYASSVSDYSSDGRLFQQSRTNKNGTLQVVGRDGDNLLTGGALADKLYGYAGADTLNGQAGNDYLSGGTGADTFVFGLGFGRDRIVDFSGEDRLQISAELLALTGAADLAGVLAEVAVQRGTKLDLRFTGSDVITLDNTELASLILRDDLWVLG